LILVPDNNLSLAKDKKRPGQHLLQSPPSHSQPTTITTTTTTTSSIKHRQAESIMAIINNSNHNLSSSLDAGKPAKAELTSAPFAAGFASAASPLSSSSADDGAIMASCYVTEVNSTLIHNFHYRSTREQGVQWRS